MHLAVRHRPSSRATSSASPARTVNASRSFVLKSGDGQKVTLQVRPGKQGKATAGYVLLGTGAASRQSPAPWSSPSAPAAATPSRAATAATDTSTTNNTNYNIILAGTGLIVGGVVAAVIGGACAIDNAHTRVGAGDAPPSGEKGTSPTTPTENPSSGGSTIVSSNHIPYFVDTQAHKLSAGVPTYTVPLFTKTF